MVRKYDLVGPGSDGHNRVVATKTCDGCQETITPVEPRFPQSPSRDAASSPPHHGKQRTDPHCLRV